MRRLIALLAFIPSLAVAQPTQAQYDALLARVTLLEKVVDVAGFMGPQIPCDSMEAKRPAASFPNGEYGVTYRQKQLGCGTNAFNSKMPPNGRTVQEYVNSAVAAAQLSRSPVVVVPPPSPAPAPPRAPSAGMFAPLTPAEVQLIIGDLQRNSRWPWHPEWVKRISDELTAGIYSINDEQLLTALRDFYYTPASRHSKAEQDAMFYYLSIIDQHDDAGNPLPPNQIKRVSGSAPTPAPTPSTGTTVRSNVVDGKLCVLDGPGAVPSLCGLAQTAGIVLGFGADIALCSSVDRSYNGGVAPFKQHCGRIGVAPEGGIRIGYNESFNNPFYDAAHMQSTFGFDSAGELSLIQQCSMQQPGCSPHEYTQDMVVRINEPAKEIIFASYRPGWRFCFVTSTGLITIDKKYCLPQQ
jgi:hypothetical protein